MWSFLLYTGRIVVSIFRTRYKYLFFFFFLLLYRIEFLPDTGGGFAKIVQAVALVAVLYLLVSNCPSVFQLSFSSTTGSVSSCLLLYLFAVLSSIWAFLPSFALSLSSQNIVLLLLFVWFFSFFNNFHSLERALLMCCAIIQLFQFICIRFYEQSLFIHFLPGASVAAFSLSYCVGEYMNMKEMDSNRLFLFKYVGALSAFCLLLYSSGGANAAVVCAIGVAMFLGGKRIYAVILLAIGILLFLNKDLVDQLILTLMPGKSMETIQNGNGRDAIWEAIIASTSERPIYGWGFACAERTVSNVIEGQILSDAHNSYIGIYGGLGYIGCILFGYHLVRMFFDIFPFVKYPGYLGLFSVFVCACVNMYSYGFLSGKACSITMVYFMLVALTYHYKRVLSQNV